MKLSCSSRKERNSGAFTIVETLVAMGIMAICLAGLMAASSMGIETVRQARDDLRATQIMSQRLEVLRLFTWSQITNESYLSTATFTEYYDPLSTNKGAQYSGSYSLSNCPFSATYSDALKMVRVTLAWTNGLIYTNVNGTRSKIPYVHTRTMDTLVCSNGLQNYIY